MNSQLLRDIQILALDAVENTTFDSFYRKVSRWYSKEFSTPLHIVESLDPIHVLQHYYEERFGEAYQPNDQNQMEIYGRIKQAICFPDELDKIEQDDDDWVKEMQELIQKENEKKEEQKNTLENKALTTVNTDAELPNINSDPVKNKLDSGEEIFMGGEPLYIDNIGE